MNLINCECCGKKTTKNSLNLGNHPISKNLNLKVDSKFETFEHKYIYCSKCVLFQQKKFISINKLKKDKNWEANKEENKHHHELIDKIIEDKFIDKNSKIFFTSEYDNLYYEKLKKLKFTNLFKLNQYKIFKLVKNNHRQDIIQKFLNKSNAKKIINEYGKFDIIFVSSILDHSHYLNKFVNFFYLLLRKHGKIIVEVPDQTKLFKSGDVTVFWEEHRFYFNKYSLQKVFYLRNFNLLKLFRFRYSQEDFITGVFNKGKSKVKMKENQKINYFNLFVSKFNSHSTKSRKIIDSLCKKKYKIFIFGAGHSGLRFIYFYDLSNDIYKILDDNPKKINLFVPSTNIQICSISFLKKISLNNILILNAASLEKENIIIDNLKNKFKLQNDNFKSIYSLSPRFIFK